MKSKVFVSSACGVEDTSSQTLGILFDELAFSNVEVYKDVTEMDFESFIDRIKLDENAKPQIRLCNKDTVEKYLQEALDDNIDNFLFLIPENHMAHFEPIISNYLEGKKVTYKIYIVKSESYPVFYMAQESISMFKKGHTMEEVLEMLEFTDTNNAIYLYSPLKEQLSTIERYTYLEELYNITDDGSYFYTIKSNNVISNRLKPKQKTIEPFIEKYKEEIKDKEVLPFIVCANKDSKYVDLFKKVLISLFPKMKKPKMIVVSPSFVLKYGINCCGFGYILKNK